ncbi:MAG: hypothetical protein K2I29_01280 [Clostridia bacterium]|nr:hypothetical protein [Clostridia bacterium]
MGDVDNLEFLDKLIYDLPDITFAEKRKVLKKRIKEIFVYDKNPPKWIEEPYWQFRNGKPMKFKEQYRIYDGCRYVFYDDEGEIEIEQYD